MFHLKFKIPPSPIKIDLKDRIYLSGSCFSDEISFHLSESKFQVLANPFGTIYNPISICKPFVTELDNNRILENQELYYHWDAHGKIASTTKSGLEKMIMEASNKHTNFLSKTDWLILTFGSSIVYEKSDGSIVANCHKRPGTEFRQRFLKQEEIKLSVEATRNRLHTLRPNAQIILTVSPVRHVKDGLIENNRSKAILLDSVHQLTKSFENIHYFPSYEILIDELRDYRFYKHDLVHPNDQAISYVWEKFKEAFFSENTTTVLNDWDKIRRSIQHRPFHANTKAHSKFLDSTLQKLEGLREVIEVEPEINSLRQQLRDFEDQ